MDAMASPKPEIQILSHRSGVLVTLSELRESKGLPMHGNSDDVRRSFDSAASLRMTI